MTLTAGQAGPICRGHDDDIQSTHAPPPPYRHGTGALARIIVTPRAAGPARGTFPLEKSALLASVRSFV